MKENKEGRNNVILLTIIALVTMVVVVIGATFAYLAGTVDTRNSTVVNATTEADTDMLLYDAGQSLEVHANPENFGEDDTNIDDMTLASVTLQTDKPEGASYNYSVFLEVPTNDFVYTSGTCTGITSLASDYTEKSACTEAGNVWGKLKGEDDTCYIPSGVNTDSYDNENVCLNATRGDHIWVTDDSYAELVLDIYRDDAALTEETTCVAAGKCVDKSRNILTDVTSADSCDGTWLTNIYENGVCYSLDKAVDVTTLVTNDGETYSLYDSETITSVDGYAKHYYKAVITFINFDHNQIVNGNKSFNGNLVFETVR